MSKSFIVTNADAAMREQAQQRLNNLTKPQGSLGLLEDALIWLCGWQRTITPHLNNAHTVIFAGNHGVTARGVSAYPAAVTAQMVQNFKHGGAAINQLCQHQNASLRVIELCLDTPTADFTVAPALTPAQYAAAFTIGQDAVPAQADVLILGEMGIGNTTSAAALACYIAGKGQPLETWVGQGTGVDAQQWQNKCAAVQTALQLHQAHMARQTDATLQCIGGWELVALAGAIMRARERSIPVLLDGYVVTAAAAALTLSHGAHILDHCYLGHLSAEVGHITLAQHLGLKPLLQLNMRLGEASGAQLSLSLLRAAVAVFNGMSTFAQAGVSVKTNAEQLT